jgi:hypothetical protein
MTIQELTEKLKTFPPDTMLVIRSYEDGCNDISDFKEVSIKLNAYKEWYYGQHGDSDDVNATKAIAITGVNKNSKDEFKNQKW